MKPSSFFLKKRFVVFAGFALLFYERERERERQRQRDRETETDRDRQRQTDRQRQSHTETHREIIYCGEYKLVLYIIQ